MKHVLKFSAVFLACSLVITGCGGGGSSSNNNSANNNNPSNNNACSITNNNATDLQKAKDFINSSNAILSNAQISFSTYRPTDLAATDELAETTNIVSGLIGHVLDLANGGSLKLTSAQIEDYLDAHGYNGIYTNLNGLSVSANAGTVTVNGSFIVKVVTDYSYTLATGYKPIYGSPVTVNVSNFVVKTPLDSTISSSYSAQLSVNSAISVTTTTNQTTTLKAGADSTITLAYPTSDTLPNNIDNEIPSTGKINLMNISITSGASKLSLDQFTLNGQKVRYTAGTTTVETSFIPTSLIFKGSASQGENIAAIDATINLTNDFSNVFALDNTGNETPTNFVKGNFTVNASTTIKIGTQTNLFTAKFAGNRAAFNSAQLSNIELSVNCEKLTGTASYTGVTSTPEALQVILKHPNGASIDIQNILGLRDNPVGSKVSDIKVNGTVQGTITKSSNSVYQAKFSDNTIIVIAN